MKFWILLLGMFLFVGCDFVSANEEEPEPATYTNCYLEQTHTMTPYIFGVSCEESIESGDTVVVDIKYVEYDRSR